MLLASSIHSVQMRLKAVVEPPCAPEVRRAVVVEALVMITIERAERAPTVTVVRCCETVACRTTVAAHMKPEVLGFVGNAELGVLGEVLVTSERFELDSKAMRT